MNVLLYRWETVIGQSSKVMKQLPLVLDGSFYDTGLWLEKKTFFSILQKANRKFHTIIFKKVHYWDKNALELLSKHGSESHWIKFVQCSIVHNHLEVFHKILESFRNVEKITFDATHFNLNQPRNHLKEIKPVNLPRLRSVVWSACSFLVSQSAKFNCCLTAVQFCNFFDFSTVTEIHAAQKPEDFRFFTVCRRWKKLDSIPRHSNET